MNTCISMSNKAAPTITLLLPDLRGGGAERVCVNLANALVERGYSVDMVLLSKVGIFLEQLDSKVRVVDLQVARMRGLLVPLMRYLRQEKPTTLLACMWPLTISAVVARRLAFKSTRIIIAEHNTWSVSQAEYSTSYKLLIRKSMKILFPHADGIVAVSEGASSDLADYACIDRGMITKIYNPVVSQKPSEPCYELCPASAGWALSKFKIVSVGNLKEQKNHALLLRAFAILKRTIDAHLLLLGEGHLRYELEGMVDELGLSSRVFMPGFVDNPRPYYLQADLFVLSSDWEGLPTVLIEALAEGTPVVSTDCPSGPREILKDGQYGRLVPVGDVDGLAAAMAESLTASHDTAALKARAQDFSIEKATDRYLELLLPQVHSGTHP